MKLRVLVAGFPVQMTVVIVIIMVAVVLSTHPKGMHQILQFWREKQSVQSACSAPALSPPPGVEAQARRLGLTIQCDIGRVTTV